MSRSMKKDPHVDKRLWRRVRAQKSANQREPLKTWRRACTIIPDFVGHTFAVHNGKTFVRVFVTEEVEAHKLGEFALTRTFKGHSADKKVAAPAPTKRK